VIGSRGLAERALDDDRLTAGEADLFVGFPRIAARLPETRAGGNTSYEQRGALREVQHLWRERIRPRSR
jgi:hypothetical protein